MIRVVGVAKNSPSYERYNGESRWCFNFIAGEPDPIPGCTEVATIGVEARAYQHDHGPHGGMSGHSYWMPLCHTCAQDLLVELQEAVKRLDAWALYGGDATEDAPR